MSISLNVVEPGADLRAPFREVLVSQVGEAPVARLSQQRLEELADLLLGPERPGKRARDVLSLAFPPGQVIWQQPYEAYYERRSRGRKLRLSKNEVMIEGLMQAVVRHCWLRYQASQRRWPHITPHVVFRAELGHCEPMCEPIHGRYWPLERANAPQAVVLNCRRPDCMCRAQPCDERTLDFLRGEGVDVHPA